MTESKKNQILFKKMATGTTSKAKSSFSDALQEPGIVTPCRNFIKTVKL